MNVARECYCIVKIIKKEKRKYLRHFPLFYMFNLPIIFYLFTQRWFFFLHELLRNERTERDRYALFKLHRVRQKLRK